MISNITSKERIQRLQETIYYTKIMNQICDYSSLIFALNTTVLLIVALTTDYWEYRGLDMNRIKPKLLELRDVTLFVPFDTTSYLQVTYKRHVSSKLHDDVFIDAVETYHAPLFLKTRHFNITAERENEWNVTTTPIANVEEVVESEFNLFQQYGNLFRDCDALEDAVRVRIGLLHKRPNRCVYFDAARHSSIVYKYVPELAHIESAACATALLCIISVCLGSCCGAYALFVRYPCFCAYQVASCLSLIAGFLLTLGIALFHGKCYVLRKLEILPGHVVPFRAELNEARLYSYGWSFSLAWVCVFFCYISSYVWLTKAQGSRRPLIRWPQKRDIELLSIADSEYEDSMDIATV